MKVIVKPEEEPLFKGMKVNFGYSYYLSGAYLPEWYKRWPLIYIVWIIYAVSSYLGGVLWLYILIKSAFLRPHDFPVLAESVHMGTLLSVTLWVPINVSYYQEEMKALVRKIGDGMYHYGDTLDEKTHENLLNIEKKHIKRKVLLTKVMQILIGTTCIAHTMLRPLGDLLTNDRLFKPDEPDGFVYKLPMDLWYPIKLHNNPIGIFIAYIHLAQLFIWGGNVINTITTVFISYCQTLCGEFEMLRYTMMRLTERAKYVYEQNCNSISSTDLKNNYIFQKCLRSVLKDSVKHQQELMKFAKNLKQLYLHFILIFLTATVFLLCFGGIMFLSKETPAAVFILYTLFVSAEIYILYWYCWFGGQIKELSMEIGNEIYNTDWVQYGSLIKTEILIIQSSREISCGLSAGGFHDIDVVTFSDVLSSTFSYFNIVNAVRN